MAVERGGSLVDRGQELLDEYFAARRRALVPSIRDEATREAVHQFTGRWLRERFDVTNVDYGKFDRAAVEAKMLGLAEAVAREFPGVISDVEMRATELFIDVAFGFYEQSLDAGHDGEHREPPTFAFLVPSRNSRLRTDYGAEGEMIAPASRSVPPDLIGFVEVGLPPFIIDRYDAGERRATGFLIHAPVYPDSMLDLPLDRAADLARSQIQLATDFARRRLGATVLGLGAVIPAITNFGTSLAAPDTTTTTGHAGTVAVIQRIIDKAMAAGILPPSGPQSLGFLGVGSIGRSAAEIIAQRFANSRIHIFDTRASAIDKTLTGLRGVHRDVQASSDVVTLIRNSEVVVSAVTGFIDLDEQDAERTLDLAGKLIVDDSQPASFDRAQVEARGGTLVWVIARDTKGVVNRVDYDYASMADAHRDLFGCEAEAACLARYHEELRERGLGDEAARRIVRRVAVREPVTAAKVRLFSALFKKYGIEAAPFQVHGEYVVGGLEGLAP